MTMTLRAILTKLVFRTRKVLEARHSMGTPRRITGLPHSLDSIISHTFRYVETFHHPLIISLQSPPKTVS